MKTINIIESKEIQDSKQLKNAFDSGYCVEIDEIIYQNFQSILDVDEWRDYYDPTIESELNRMAELAWGIVEEKYRFKD